MEMTEVYMGILPILNGISTNILALQPIRLPYQAMVSGRQIRAARALLGWSQVELADRAIVSKNALALLERKLVDSRSSTVQKVERALVRAGIEFLPAFGGRGEGARLARDDAKVVRPRR